MRKSANVRLPAGGMGRLREIAAQFGAIAPSGIKAGEPSVSELLSRVISGELVIQRKEKPMYYKFDPDKCAAVAAAIGRQYGEVQAVCCADWPEGDEHQRWLEAAPVDEIADWVATILKSDEDNA